MDETFTTKLHRLAEIIVHNAGVQPDDYVLLHTHRGADELALETVRVCYEKGARFVNHISCDQAAVRAQLLAHPGAEQYDFNTSETGAWQAVMEEDGCVIQLRIDPDPALFGDISEDYGRWYSQMWGQRNDFFARGVAGGEFAWTLFYVPTQSAAERIYPEVPKENALATYWDAIFAMTMADQPDCIAALEKSDDLLHARADALDKLKIETLHFTGPGTDLKVGLSEAALWLGGSKDTHGTKKPRKHTVNVPTYEVYTTPDWRNANGTVCITKDVVIEGTIVTGAVVTFENGRAVEATATTGAKALQALIARDEGAAQLGEIALVGLDSPTAVRKRVFQSMLLDENAACHFAFGSAYLAAIADGDTLNNEQKEALGINKSVVHHDIMISDTNTTVIATTTDGQTIKLIENGHWTADFQ